jgi:serine/threonine protein kinase/CheY-like chemotaxis protein
MQNQRNPWRKQIYHSRRHHILVVDDESYIRALVSSALPQASYDVKVASCGREARELLEQSKFDLAIFDVNMPGESGLDLLLQVRSSHPGLEVLLMTGGFHINEELAAATEGMQPMLLKPILRAQLIAAVESGLKAAEERRNQTTMGAYTATVAFARKMPEAAEPAPELPAESLLEPEDAVVEAAQEEAPSLPSEQLVESPVPPERTPSVTLTSALADFEAETTSESIDLDQSVEMIRRQPQGAKPPPRSQSPTYEEFDAERTEEMRSPAPQIIGGYDLVRPIAASEFAVVYRAQKEVDGELRKFAVKIIHLDHRSPDAAAKFSRLMEEADSLKQVEHPCIVKPIEQGYDEVYQAPYIVHEFIKGSPLSHMLGSTKLTFHTRLRILAEISSALAVLHGRQLCHRAIKAENIIIDHQLHARLIDFGLASTPVSHIDESGLAHRLSYHPPECLTASSSLASADVYALGVLAYELFAGYNPFQASTVDGVKQAMKIKVPSSLIDIVAGFPGDLSDDLARVLAKDPEMRPTSIELSMQLRTVLDRVEPETEISLPAHRYNTIIE